MRTIKGMGRFIAPLMVTLLLAASFFLTPAFTLSQQWIGGFLRDSSGNLLVSGSISATFPSALQAQGASNENGIGTQYITECFNHLSLANQTFSANGSTTVISNTTNKTIRVCGFRVKANGAGTVRIDSVTHGGTCSSTGVGQEGPISFNAAGDGFSTGGNIGEIFELPAGTDACITIAGFSGTNIWFDMSYANI